MEMSIKGSKLGITIGVMCAAMMAVLDMTIVNVGLSDIRASFGTPLDQIGWVSVSYMMANVVVIPLSGWLQRRFGCRAYFTASLLLFTAASVLCGMAWSLPSLVIFRVLQGIGGGAIVPTAQNILLARYPKNEHSMAGALFGLGAFSGPLLGPAIGGYLIDVASWHWIFLINLPFGLLAAMLSWQHIEEPGFRPDRARIDLWGIALLAVGMASLQYAMEEGNREDWCESRTITILLIVASVALVTFVVHELETDTPVVDFRIFKDRSYAAGTGINLLCGIALFAGSYLVALYCGAVMRYSARDTGLVFLTAGSVQLLLMPALGKLGASVDGRYLVGAGVAIMCVSLWLNGHLNNDNDFWGLALPQMVRSSAMGLIFIPLSVITLSHLRADQRGNAAGLFNLTRELGGSIGTAWMGTRISQLSAQHAARLAENISPDNFLAGEQIAAMQRGLGARIFSPAEGVLSLMNLRVTLQALIRSFNEAFLLLALVFLFALLLVALLKRPAPGVKEEAVH